MRQPFALWSLDRQTAADIKQASRTAAAAAVAAAAAAAAELQAMGAVYRTLHDGSDDERLTRRRRHDWWHCQCQYTPALADCTALDLVRRTQANVKISSNNHLSHFIGDWIIDGGKSPASFQRRIKTAQTPASRRIDWWLYGDCSDRHVSSACVDYRKHFIARGPRRATEPRFSRPRPAGGVV